jgi:hypothetical protein
VRGRVYNFNELRCSSAESLLYFDVVAHGVQAILAYLHPNCIPIVANLSQVLVNAVTVHVDFKLPVSRLIGI